MRLPRVAILTYRSVVAKSGSIRCMRNDEPRSRNGSFTTDNHQPVLREPVTGPEAARLQEAQERDRADAYKAMAITVSIVIAPFLGLAFGLEVALAILAAAMAFTTWLTWSGAKRVGVTLRAKLYTMSALNAVLTLVVLGVLILRLTN